MKKITHTLSLLFLLFSCNPNPMNISTQSNPNITEETQNEAIDKLTAKYSDIKTETVTRGVRHVASLWRTTDGNENDFVEYCLENFVIDEKEKFIVFEKISKNLEILFGYYNRIKLDLNKPLHEPLGETHAIDIAFGGYEASANLMEDLFRNKIAFYIALNFPYYKLEEKNSLGTSWSRLEWAYARLGDFFASRIPPEVLKEATRVSTESDIYISEYNIYMGSVLNESGRSLFPADMTLLSHWNLRDEIKANYNKGEEGLEKQANIYQVMQRIIDQSIPEKVINNGDYQWNPFTNEVFADNNKIEAAPEPNTRYQQILDNFHALKKIDPYSPINTAVRRGFEEQMEFSQAEIEAVFVDFLSSKEVKQVGQFIAERLGRELKPWDIWYDGFKARSNIDENKLNAITESRYPNADSFNEDLPGMLLTLGFSEERAKYISDKIVVDPASGSGHAWGAQMKGDVAHLRTRIPVTGMNYKGYNIAVHEFGHNVEQTISLYDVDNYVMNGVPNTAFTEALAFIFQKRDLELLGITDNDKNKNAMAVLDNFWSTVEIMGVSLLDQRVWKWLYENPEANAAELKAAVLRMSKEIWNQFYAPVFGQEDETILAVYSHMISYPLYLSNYAVGNLIEFQIEQHLERNDFAGEVQRIYQQGRYTPQIWMMEAVGDKISTQPILNETGKALETLAN
jgi:hypothetical protein